MSTCGDFEAHLLHMELNGECPWCGAAEAAEAAVTATEPENYETIELECPPGWPRPWDLIVGVCEGTGLEVTSDPVPCTFGYSCWAFKISREEWVERIQPIIKPRIEALYAAGAIRAGSW